MIDLFGWLGAILFIVCAMPQTWKVLKNKRVDDLSPAFLWLWLGAIISISTHFILAGTFLLHLQINYGITLILVLVLLVAYYKYKKK